MKKKEVNINEESTSAGGAHAVNKFRISDFVMLEENVAYHTSRYQEHSSNTADPEPRTCHGK